MFTWKNLLVLALAMAALSLNALGQHRRLAFNQVDSEDGMPPSRVLAILPRQEGPVWFGTTSGLYEYDGKSVRPVPTEAGLTFVSALHQSKDGRIWIGTRNGLFIWHEGDVAKVSIPRRGDDRQPFDFITEIAEGESGEFYVASHVGLYKVSKNGSLSRIILDTRPRGYRSASDVVFSIDIDAAGHCWCGTGAGLYRVTPDGASRRIINPLLDDASLPASLVSEVTIGPQEECWFVGRKGAYRMAADMKTCQEVVDSEGQPIEKGSMFGKDSEGGLWLGTMSRGVARIGSNCRAALIPVNVPGNELTFGTAISTLIISDDDTLWLGSDPGVQFVDIGTHDFAWIQPAQIGKQANYFTLSTRRDQEGRLWVGTWTHGLQVLFPDGKAAQCLTTTDRGYKLNLSRVDFVVHSEGGRTVVGNLNEGLYERGPEGFSQLSLPFVKNPEVEFKSVIFRGESLVVAHGRQIWEETSQGWKEVLFTSSRAPAEFSLPFHCLSLSEAGRLYFRTDIGIFIERNNGEFLWCGAANDEAVDIKLFGDNIRAVVEIGDGMFLVALTVGVCQVDVARKSSTETAIVDENGWELTSIEGLARDSDGHVWATTGNRLHVVNLTEKKVRTFGPHQGVQPGTLGRIELTGTKKDEFCVHGLTGTTIFTSEESEKYSSAPIFRLHGCQVNGLESEEIKNGGAPDLSWEQNNLRFELAAFHYQNPGRNRFAFRFAGDDQGWQGVGSEGVIHLPRLSPGQYTIEARARSGDGIWSDAREIARFTIVPPIWRRTWFQLVVALTFIFGLIGYHFFRIRQADRLNEELEATVAERTESLRSRNQELQGIQGLLKTVNLAGSLEGLLEGTLHQALEALEATSGTFLVLDETTGLFDPRSTVGRLQGLDQAVSRDELHAMLEDRGSEVAVGIYLSSQALRSTGTRRISMKLLEEDRAHSYLVLERADDAPSFSAQSVLLMERLREPVSIAMQRLRMLNVLGELNEKKTELLGAAAHDLRSPLSAMSLTAENLLAKDPEAAVKNLQKDVGRILKTTTRMTDLVNKLLDVAAIDSGRVALALDETDLNALLASRVAVARADAERKRIALLFESDADEARLLLDSERFAAAVDNLVSNALKYTHPGGRVVVRLGRVDARFQIAVEDDGQGLPQEDVAKLFKSFSRLSAKPTGNETSTGFGLAIVKKVVDLHGGEVWAESEVGKGSTFTISIPEAPGAAS